MDAPTKAFLCILALTCYIATLSLEAFMIEQTTAHPTSSAAPAASALSHGDVAAIDELRVDYEKLRRELARVIIGQDNVIEQLLICVLARGHGLLMGVPGLAKTTIVNALAQAMTLEFNRIQFTPDLMPSDITGTDILQETDQPGRRAFVFIKGPSRPQSNTPHPQHLGNPD